MDLVLYYKLMHPTFLRLKIMKSRFFLMLHVSIYCDFIHFTQKKKKKGGKKGKKKKVILK